ncbi:MAG: SPOR domain-containing protein [Lewinella sp.]|nr:SPOR domain-containing protein [Lewinella sp.]
MQMTHYAMLAQALFALAVAFYLTRKLRGTIRAVVVRLMPIKHRISDESFNLQTRFSAVAAYLTGLLLAGLIYWGVESLTTQLFLASPEQQQRIYDIDPPRKETPTVLPPVPANDDSKHNEPESSAAPGSGSSGPAEEVDAPPPTHTSTESGAYYLQLFAFRDMDRAQTQQSIYEARLPRPVMIIRVNSSPAPYKVVVGPFSSREAALEFRNWQQLRGVIVEQRLFR